MRRTTLITFFVSLLFYDSTCGHPGRSRGGYGTVSANLGSAKLFPAYFLPDIPSDWIRGSYGNTFGPSGLGDNTFISKNYYGGPRLGGISPYLVTALFNNADSSPDTIWEDQKWNETDERYWRKTTKAPYFDNKLPGKLKSQCRYQNYGKLFQVPKIIYRLLLLLELQKLSA